MIEVEEQDTYVGATSKAASPFLRCRLVQVVTLCPSPRSGPPR
jgi:hypothetical protein